MTRNFIVTQLNDIPPVPCPCGQSRRGFGEVTNGPATVHIVDISAEARTHYHKKLTEIYVILEGEGHLELDGEKIPLRPMTSVMILPGCRHRAVGKLKVLNLVIPQFDPADEHFD
jgi:mannose-6-phosphate isomerase-like protein (cupin superfamily)